MVKLLKLRSCYWTHLNKKKIKNFQCSLIEKTSKSRPKVLYLVNYCTKHRSKNRNSSAKQHVPVPRTRWLWVFWDTWNWVSNKWSFSESTTRFDWFFNLYYLTVKKLCTCLPIRCWSLLWISAFSRIIVWLELFTTNSTFTRPNAHKNDMFSDIRPRYF